MNTLRWTIRTLIASLWGFIAYKVLRVDYIGSMRNDIIGVGFFYFLIFEGFFYAVGMLFLFTVTSKDQFDQLVGNIKWKLNKLTRK